MASLNGNRNFTHATTTPPTLVKNDTGHSTSPIYYHQQPQHEQKLTNAVAHTEAQHRINALKSQLRSSVEQAFRDLTDTVHSCEESLLRQVDEGWTEYEAALSTQHHQQQNLPNQMQHDHWQSQFTKLDLNDPTAQAKEPLGVELRVAGGARERLPDSDCSIASSVEFIEAPLLKPTTTRTKTTGSETELWGFSRYFSGINSATSAQWLIGRKVGNEANNGGEMKEKKEVLVKGPPNSTHCCSPPTTSYEFLKVMRAIQESPNAHWLAVNKTMTTAKKN